MAGPWGLIGAPLDSSGSGRGEARAPSALRRAGLITALGLEDGGDVCARLDDTRRDPASGVIAHAQLVQASRVLRDAVASALTDGVRPLVVGGDCSVLPGALAAARDRHDALRLWMLDGHPDTLDGSSSPTGEAADMDLAIVLGRGSPELTRLARAFPIVDPGATWLVGHRPASAGEDVAAELALVPAAVRQVTAPELRRRGAAATAAEMLADAGAASVWLHLDLDVLDEEELPAVSYRQGDGMHWDELEALLSELLGAPGLIGVSLADFEPDRDPDGTDGGRVVATLAAAWPTG